MRRARRVCEITRLSKRSSAPQRSGEDRGDHRRSFVLFVLRNCPQTWNIVRRQSSITLSPDPTGSAMAVAPAADSRIVAVCHFTYGDGKTEPSESKQTRGGKYG